MFSTEDNFALIAPCGMDCRLCSSMQDGKKACPGCRNMAEKPKCVIIRCKFLPDAGFCYDCQRFPCRRLSELDNRYVTRYGMSMLANLDAIKERGLQYFIDLQDEKWKCPGCGHLICIHKPKCLYCKTANVNYNNKRTDL